MTALGYVVGEARGVADRVLAEVAANLTARGLPLAGVVQVNTDSPRSGRCDMDLTVLGLPAEMPQRRIRISQNLGPQSRGCRLDYRSLEEAVGLVGSVMPGKRLLMVNKFGKTELEGRGFRPLIAQALEEDLPVLIGVNTQNLPGFLAYCDGLGTALRCDRDAILRWCEEQTGLSS